MKSLNIELATGELKALLYALEVAHNTTVTAELKMQLRNVHRKVVKNIKEI